MSGIDDLIVGLIALNGGELVSKIRLQKTFYLLEQCGLNSRLDFEYHYYGPFSDELAEAADDAVFAERVEAEPRFGNHSVPYVIYRTSEGTPDHLGDLEQGEVRKKLNVMRCYSSPELEIAATILYLKEEGFDEDSIEETKMLKPVKATEKRIGRAQQLLRELELEDS